MTEKAELDRVRAIHKLLDELVGHLAAGDRGARGEAMTTTPHPALTYDAVLALLAMATEHLLLVSALNHLREKGWYLWHEGPGQLDDESQGATVLDSVYSVAKQTGWTPETAESPESEVERG